MYALYAGKKIIGYMSLSKEGDNTYELHNLAVLPEYQHNGFGKLLLNYAKDTVKALGGNTIKIGIICVTPVQPTIRKIHSLKYKSTGIFYPLKQIKLQ